MTSAATAPKTLAMLTFANAALPPPAAKNMPYATNAAGTTRWKFLGTAGCSPSVGVGKAPPSISSTR
jgi:hypothetical protein